MKMNVVEAYDVKKCIYTDMPWENTLYNKKNFAKVTELGDFMSYFTDWAEPKWNSVWIGNKIKRHWN